MKNNARKYTVMAFLGVIILLGTQGCFTMSYTTSGASIPESAQTVSVSYFRNNAPLVNPGLSQELTDGLKDKFISQTRLSLVNGVGDLHFEGEITGYDTKPMAIKDGDVASENRLTVTIRVKYVNAKDPESKYDFDKTFSRYEDYDSSNDLSSVEDELTEKIVEQLVEDIFNESVVNW